MTTETRKHISRAHFDKYAKLSEGVPNSALPPQADSADKVLRAFEADEHLNSIPLRYWDRMTGWNERTQTTTPGPWHGLRGLSNAERCCVLKHIALYRIAGITPVFED